MAPAATINDVHYDPDTGEVTWTSTVHKRKRGARAGTVKSGYRYVRLSGHGIAHHRIAFIKMTGSAPKMVDHINGNIRDNRWVNLRACTQSQNCSNAKVRSDYLSGSRGVKFHQGQWVAKIRHERQRYDLIRTPHRRIAELVYMHAARLFKGDFANV